MSSPINDGGPAFPRSATRGSSGMIIRESQQGMSMRDYFAGQALAGIMAGHYVSNAADWVPTTAYRMADAMIEARSKKEDRR